MTDDLDILRRRAAYRAHHRGTKEMDWLLGRFADARLEQMDIKDLEQFEQFMSLPDPMLNNWIMQPGERIDDDYVALVDQIRAFHCLGD